MLPSTNVTIIKCLDSHFARYGVLVGWFSNLYWVQICVRGEGDVSSENGYHIPPQYTLLWPRANGEVEHENCSLIVVPVTRSRTFRFC